MAVSNTEANRNDLMLKLGESCTSTLFRESDLEHLLASSNSINEASSTGWLMKADRLIAQYPLASISLGSESYKFQSITEILDYCRERSRHYAKLAGKASGIVLAMTPSISGDAQ